MATVIRPELSIKNKYHIDKHRHYELKHFCLQYPMWKKTYTDLSNIGITISAAEKLPSSNLPGDPTAKRAVARAQLVERIEMVENIAK